MLPLSPQRRTRAAARLPQAVLLLSRTSVYGLFFTAERNHKTCCPDRKNFHGIGCIIGRNCYALRSATFVSQAEKLPQVSCNTAIVTFRTFSWSSTNTLLSLIFTAPAPKVEDNERSLLGLLFD
ncbi:hypothetical protein [Calothrix sp. NIES-2100]|uniref:hypothetical protein n=1 Tax=Calothrix sp. NIES-2100 TaxID=1954172 RepID=UPI0030DDDB04